MVRGRRVGMGSSGSRTRSNRFVFGKDVYSEIEWIWIFWDFSVDNSLYVIQFYNSFLYDT